MWSWQQKGPQSTRMATGVCCHSLWHCPPNRCRLLVPQKYSLILSITIKWLVPSVWKSGVLLPCHLLLDSSIENTMNRNSNRHSCFGTDMFWIIYFSLVILWSESLHFLDNDQWPQTKKKKKNHINKGKDFILSHSCVAWVDRWVCGWMSICESMEMWCPLLGS